MYVFFTTIILWMRTQKQNNVKLINFFSMSFMSYLWISREVTCIFIIMLRNWYYTSNTLSYIVSKLGALDCSNCFNEVLSKSWPFKCGLSITFELQKII